MAGVGEGEGESESKLCYSKILSRLPIKSLLRFNCVCKSWRSLITSPGFVTLQLNRANSEEEEDSDSNYLRHVMASCHESSFSLAFYSFDFEGSNHGVIELDEGSDSKLPCPNANVLGSCNGLLLIDITGKTFFLWNPSTREYKKFSAPLHFGVVDSYVLSGFGFDSSMDDYKAVFVCRISKPLGDGDNYEEKHVLVYSFKTNKWKLIGDFQYRILSTGTGSGTLVNGSPHWLVGHNFNEDYRVIVYFDLGKNQFDEVPLPNFEDGNSIVDVEGLGTLKGWLCLVQNFYGSHFEIWVMKEYGVKESWTSMIIIPQDTTICCLKPLCFTKNGEIIMEINQMEIVVFNLESYAYRHIAFSENRHGFKVATYVESLVSPNCFKENKGPEGKRDFPSIDN